jgi:hypothetical protein
MRTLLLPLAERVATCVALAPTMIIAQGAPAATDVSGVSMFDAVPEAAPTNEMKHVTLEMFRQRK